MSHRNLSRLIAAGALVTLLALPGVARADAGAVNAAGVWQWFVSLLSTVWTSGEVQNIGPGVDPNGGTVSGQRDIGPGVDPNGG